MVSQEETLSERASSSLADYFENIYNVTNNENNQDYDTTNSSEWGPIRDSLYIVIPITVVYALIFITGVIGNVSTCIVISRNKSMHTATNYYLFSLAVSDLLLLISGLPPEMYLIWSKYPYIFGEPFCILQGFAAETSANATVLTITAFTVERYVAICHPFLSHTMSKLSRAIKFVVAIWVVAMCLAVPQAMAFGIVYHRTSDGTIEDENYSICAVKREIIPHAFELSTLVFFVAPMSLISVLYILIALQLRRSRIVRRGSLAQSVELKHRVSKTQSGQTLQSMVVTEEGTTVLNRPPTINEEPQQTTALNCREDGRKNYHRNMHSKATKHVVNMLIAVVVAFFICWAPFHAQRLLAIHAYSLNTPEIIALYRFLTYLSGVLYYLSTCINPFLYNIMSNKFRNAFRETLSRYLAVGRRSRVPARRYSTLSLPRSVSPTRSQSLSQSGGHSRNASLRKGRDTDMARRPLVVTFRKPRNNLPSTCIHAPRCTCRINYPMKPDPPPVEETSLTTKEPFETPTKVKIFKKWGKKKPTMNTNISCKVICSECHRYLSNEPESQRKMSATNDNSISSNNDEYIRKNSSDSIKNSIRVMNNDPMPETDLVPHHMCPNQYKNSLLRKNQNLPNGLVKGTHSGVTHSKTMPDIVKYALPTSKTFDSNEIAPVVVEINPTKEEKPDAEKLETESETKADEQISSDVKGHRRWGSEENLQTDNT